MYLREGSSWWCWSNGFGFSSLSFPPWVTPSSHSKILLREMKETRMHIALLLLLLLEVGFLTWMLFQLETNVPFLHFHVHTSMNHRLTFVWVLMNQVSLCLVILEEKRERGEERGCYFHFSSSVFFLHKNMIVIHATLWWLVFCLLFHPSSLSMSCWCFTFISATFCATMQSLTETLLHFAFEMKNISSDNNNNAALTTRRWWWSLFLTEKMTVEKKMRK